MAALKQGSKGTDVTKLQNQLKNMGYYTGSIDGSFGSQTLAAVKAYQKSQGLAVDGSVGPLTQAALGWTKSSVKPVAGKTEAPQVPKIEAFKADETNKPALPEIAPPPTIDPFKPNIDRAQFQQDALALLLPQYQRGQEQLQDLYTHNQQYIENDSLKRGLARGSYVGNRLDTETTEHGKRLGDLDRSYNEQANLMAAQNYDSEWNKQFMVHQDTTSNIWRGYSAEVDNAWRNFDALMSLYNVDLDTQKFGYQTDVDSQWKGYGAEWDKYRAGIADTQWQEQFDWQKKMDQENLALAKSKGSGSGKSSGSTIDPFTLAMNDLINSTDPYSTFQSKKSQYATSLTDYELQQLEAYANANKPKKGFGDFKVTEKKLGQSGGGGNQKMMLY